MGCFYLFREGRIVYLVILFLHGGHCFAKQAPFGKNHPKYTMQTLWAQEAHTNTKVYTPQYKVTRDFLIVLVFTGLTVQRTCILIKVHILGGRCRGGGEGKEVECSHDVEFLTFIINTSITSTSSTLRLSK